MWAELRDRGLSLADAVPPLPEAAGGLSGDLVVGAPTVAWLGLAPV